MAMNEQYLLVVVHGSLVKQPAVAGLLLLSVLHESVFHQLAGVFTCGREDK